MPWTCLIKSRVTIWHEVHLRQLSCSNSKMKYLNVELTGLSGAPHPALRDIRTSQEVKKLRIHLKFLTFDYPTNERLWMYQPHHSPACTLCHCPLDSTDHVLTACSATLDVRSRLLPELLNTVAKVQPSCALLDNHTDTAILTQFILDCTSINLPDRYRVPAHNPEVSNVFSISRDWCFAISSERTRLLLKNT